MDDKNHQKTNLEAIYSAASLSPVFKYNPKFSQGKFAGLTPYISYDDVMDNKYIIRGRPLSADSSFDSEEQEIIAEYNTIESLVDDGWRLD